MGRIHPWWNLLVGSESISRFYEGWHLCWFPLFSWWWNEASPDKRDLVYKQTGWSTDSRWGRNIMGEADSCDHNPHLLFSTVFFMIGFYFALQSGDQHRKLQYNHCQIQVVEKPVERPHLLYTEYIPKKCLGGLKGANWRWSHIMPTWRILAGVWYTSLGSTTAFVRLIGRMMHFISPLWSNQHTIAGSLVCPLVGTAANVSTMCSFIYVIEDSWSLHVHEIFVCQISIYLICWPWMWLAECRYSCSIMNVQLHTKV